MEQSPSPEPQGRRTPRGLSPEPAPPRRDRRPLIVGAGAFAALVIGVAVALGVFREDPADDVPPPAAEGGLKIEFGQTQGGDTIDPARPLRCFADGRFVGELTVAQCAQRNGVAAQRLDVGVDETGALAAVVAVPGLQTQPARPETELAEAASADALALPAPAQEPGGECLRHVDGQWRPLGEDLPLETCLEVLYAGRCEPPGSAAYGRWNGQTLRLVTGRVEIASDGANFRTLAQQDPSTCVFP